MTAEIQWHCVRARWQLGWPTGRVMKRGRSIAFPPPPDRSSVTRSGIANSQTQGTLHRRVPIS